MPLNDEYARALQGIATLRNAGFSDEEIFAMPREFIMGPGASSSLRLGGGYEFLQPAITAAGIGANLELGRERLGLERGMALSELAGRPYNIISALDAYARFGTPVPLNNPIVQAVQPYFPGGASSGATTGAAGGAGYNLATATAGGQPGNALEQGARLLGSSLGGINFRSSPNFRNVLLGGGVPGLGSITEEDLGRMNYDQRQAYYGTLLATGRASGPEDIEDYYRRYSQRGSQLGGVYR